MPRESVVKPQNTNSNSQGFIIPSEYVQFCEAYSKDEKPAIWIVKPNDKSRGRGIFLISDISQLAYDQQCVIQRYIPNPLLVGGYKQDLRIYILVTSVHPLRAYIFKDGLVRFSTEKYDTGDLSNLFSHLTNTSINKKAKNISTEKEVIGAGCKWTLLQLKEYLMEKQGLTEEIWAKLWIRMCNVCILTLMLLCQSVPKDTQSCFALYGFDLMVDSNLKPWMIEVNASPALNLDEPTDVAIKNPLISDAIRILTHSPEVAAEKREQFYREEASRLSKPRGEAARKEMGGAGRGKGMSRGAGSGITKQVGTARTVLDAGKAVRGSSTEITAKGESNVRSRESGRSKSSANPSDKPKAQNNSTATRVPGAKETGGKAGGSTARAAGKPLNGMSRTHRAGPKMSVRETRLQEERRLADPALRESRDHGNFEVMFPFNETVADAAWTMADDAAQYKLVVDQIRARELSAMGGAKVQFGKSSAKAHKGKAPPAGGKAPPAGGAACTKAGAR